MVLLVWLCTVDLNMYLIEHPKSSVDNSEEAVFFFKPKVQSDFEKHKIKLLSRAAS